MRSVWAMPRVAPISACSSPPWNSPQGCAWCRGDTKLIDLHWTPQSCCHQGYSRKALRFHLQHLSVSSVYVKRHRKKKSNQILWMMQDVDVRELHKMMNNYIHPNYTPGLGSAPWEEQFFSKLYVYPLWGETFMVLSLETVQKHHVHLLFC